MNNLLSALLTIFALQVIIVDKVSSYEIDVINNCKFQIFAKSDRGSSMIQPGQNHKFFDPSRVEAHQGCDSAGNNCDTTTDVSLAEMHWDPDGKSWYDISQVDGFNLPITIEPFNPNVGGRCEKVGCNYDLNNCPGESKGFKQSRIVNCKNVNRDAPTEYSRSIKSACPNVYSWSQDDRAGMRDCMPGNNGLRVIFC